MNAELTALMERLQSDPDFATAVKKCTTLDGAAEVIADAGLTVSAENLAAFAKGVPVGMTDADLEAVAGGSCVPGGSYGGLQTGPPTLTDDAICCVN